MTKYCNEINTMLYLAKKGIGEIIQIQDEVLGMDNK